MRFLFALAIGLLPFLILLVALELDRARRRRRWRRRSSARPGYLMDPTEREFRC